MVDEKITELAVIAVLDDTDLFPLVDDVGGTPITKAIAHSDFVSESIDQIEAALVGKKTVYISASFMAPSITNGCAVLSNSETTAGRPDLFFLGFDGSNVENAQFSYSFPKSWDNGTITYHIYWTTVAAGAGDVSWKLSAVAVSDDDTIDVVYGTAIEVVDAFIAVEDMHITEESTAVTIAGTPAQGDMVYFNIQRDPDDSNDDLVQDAKLLGIKVFYTADSLKDD